MKSTADGAAMRAANTINAAEIHAIARLSSLRLADESHHGRFQIDEILNHFVTAARNGRVGRDGKQHAVGPRRQELHVRLALRRRAGDQDHRVATARLLQQFRHPPRGQPFAGRRANAAVDTVDSRKLRVEHEIAHLEFFVAQESRRRQTSPCWTRSTPRRPRSDRAEHRPAFDAAFHGRGMPARPGFARASRRRRRPAPVLRARQSRLPACR